MKSGWALVNDCREQIDNGAIVALVPEPVGPKLLNYSLLSRCKIIQHDANTARAQKVEDVRPAFDHRAPCHVKLSLPSSAQKLFAALCRITVPSTDTPQALASIQSVARFPDGASLHFIQRRLN
jgi:hypothetical protein